MCDQRLLPSTRCHAEIAWIYRGIVWKRVSDCSESMVCDIEWRLCSARRTVLAMRVPLQRPPPADADRGGSGLTRRTVGRSGPRTAIGGVALATIKRFATKVAAFGAAVLMATTGTATAAYAGNSPWAGCPSEAVCLWAGEPSSPGRIIYIWWSGVYQLQNVYGVHQIKNNQTDGWVVDLCTGWNGNSCVYRLAMDEWTGYNFTPINSVWLHP